MLAGRISVFAAIVGMSALPALAAEGPARQQADNAPSPAPSAIAPAPTTSGPLGFAQDFAERLAATGNLAAADREDRAALAKFYADRQQEPAWTSATGLTPAAAALIAEIRRAGDWGLEAAAFQLPASSGIELSRAGRADAEIALSLAILKYARHARGGRAEPTSLSRNLDRKLPLLDPGQVIEQASKAAEPDAYLRSLHPQHPQFEALRQKYLALTRGQAIAPSDPSLSAEGSKGGKKTAGVASETSQARRVLINMEQWRWMPESLGDFFVWVNIPEYTLRVVKGSKLVHTERVIVGKRDTQTPVFSQDMEQVIFHPFWGIPESIKRNDVLPSLVRGSSRLFDHYNLRIQRGGRDIDPASVDWASADIRQFHVYQPPGPNSVLGVMKFRFPNKHDVYMHDTPTKNLFNAEVRMFSHGCVRVREPQRLAELVLAEDQGWPASRVAAAISGGPQNNQIGLTRRVPVHMTYFTAVIDRSGELKLFADIYGHEQRIALGMEGKTHLVARMVKEEKPPTRADAVGSLAETATGGAPGGSKKDWVRRAFDFGGN
jgi:murein L,D-transpeptidase YcbB/YkuD